MDIDLVRRRAVSAALFAYPLLAAFAFAVHPNLTSLAVGTSTIERIREFHGNEILHFGHLLMGLAVLPLIAVALHLSERLEKSAPWTSLIGACLAVAGAVVLAMDKAALCFVPSAFDTLGEVDFAGLAPGIAAMFENRGNLWVLRFLPALPLGFIILSLGLVRTRTIERRYSVPMLAGAVLMLNPDIDLIGLAATAVMAVGFFPYAARIARKSSQSR